MSRTAQTSSIGDFPTVTHIPTAVIDSTNPRFFICEHTHKYLWFPHRETHICYVQDCNQIYNQFHSLYRVSQKLMCNCKNPNIILTANLGYTA
jgi:hypothetical protein